MDAQKIVKYSLLMGIVLFTLNGSLLQGQSVAIGGIEIPVAFVIFLVGVLYLTRRVELKEKEKRKRSRDHSIVWK